MEDHDALLVEPDPGQLAAVEDVVDPWNPTHLLFVTFFGGFLSGGMLLARNANRLGLDRHFWPIVATTIVVELTLIATVGYVTWRTASPEGRRQALVEEILEKASASEDRESFSEEIEEMFRREQGKTPLDRLRSEEVKKQRGLFRDVWRFIGLAVAIVFFIPQRRRFHWAEDQGVRRGKLLRPAIVTIGLCFVVELSLITVLLLVVLGT